MKFKIPFASFCLYVIGFPGLLQTSLQAASTDWPMYRANSARTGSVSFQLPSKLQLHWTLQLPPAKPAWPASQFKLQFDTHYEPIIVGDLLIVGSNVNDSITAYDLKTGQLRWQFFCEAPVRFAPVAWKNQIYAVGDDGSLYCLDSRKGSLNWKYSGSPAERRILGNNRLISSWPCRGGVVIAEGVAYFTAGLWPNMGIFIHAVDAKTGKKIWTNSELGSLFRVHPHGASSFGSLVPQGYLAVSGEKLYVPGGRTLPAVLDCNTGKLLHFEFGGKGSGHHQVMTGQTVYQTGNELFSTSEDKSISKVPFQLIFNQEFIGYSGGTLFWCTEGKLQKKVFSVDRKGNRVEKSRYQFMNVQTLRLKEELSDRLFLCAGSDLYFGGKDRIARYRFDGSQQSCTLISSHQVAGTVASIIAGSSSLVVITKEGHIHCFREGAFNTAKKNLNEAATESRADFGQPQEKGTDNLSHLFDLVGSHKPSAGYCMILGSEKDPSDSFFSNPKYTKWKVIAMEEQPDKLKSRRQTVTKRNIPFERYSLLSGSFRHIKLPPYFASLVVVEESLACRFSQQPQLLQKAYQTLRPYGGTLCLELSEEEHAEFVKQFEEELHSQAEFKTASLSRKERFTLLQRVGPLPGAGNWTHQYGDESNSVVSQDQLAKPPFGVLWFGGPSNDKILPRHGHGPNPQVAGGRLIIEGEDILRAVDVYTGLVLWERELPQIGVYYNHTDHHPGAGEIGSNYVTRENAIYVVDGVSLLELDPATGRTRRLFPTVHNKADRKEYWGVILADDRFLVATSSPVRFPVEQKKKQKPSKDNSADSKNSGISNQAGNSKAASSVNLTSLFKHNRYGEASRRITVFDRETGKKLWSSTANFNYRHNAICIGNGHLYAIDGLSSKKLAELGRRGIPLSHQPTLTCWDLQSGKSIWQTDQAVFGTFLNYSREHDLLLEGGSQYRDRAKDEVGQGMTVFQGTTGEVLWKNESIRYSGPCLLWKDRIITNGSSGFQLELKTGKSTGWVFQRMYGCNTIIGSQHCLSFRSGAAGYCDLTTHSGTGNIGGFRSSCTSNLIPADGLLNAPDFTRTCVCAYQLQTSLALIHMPDADLWAYGTSAVIQQDVPFAKQGVGLNLNAPGDRRASNGTFWLDIPSIGGPSPQMNVELSPQSLSGFRFHSTEISSGDSQWIAASGLEGLQTLTWKIPKEWKQHSMKSEKPNRYRVRLHFLEPNEDCQQGERRFSILLQDQTVLEDFDIIAAAKESRTPLVKTIPDVLIEEELTLILNSVAGATRKPLLCGLEIQPAF